MYHTDENLKSTPIPFDLLKKVHISLAEGMAMGVGPESMMKYREDYGIPNSDAFEAEPLTQKPMGHDADQTRKEKDRIRSIENFKF